MATAGIEGAITCNGPDFLVFRDLVQKIGEHGAVALTARGEFHRPDVAGRRVHRQMDLTVLAAAVGAMVPRQPLSVARELDPGAVYQQVQRARSPARRELARDCLLAAAERREIRNRPVLTSHLEDAGDHSGRLPKRQAEEHLGHQAELDGGVGEDRRMSGLASLRRKPVHVAVQPDEQRSPPL